MTNTPLPVIVGFGGISPAGRSSNHHSYRWLVSDVLTKAKKARTLQALCALTGIKDSDNDLEQQLRANTLIRKISPHLFNVDRLPGRIGARPVKDESFLVELATRQLPDPLPASWHIEKQLKGKTTVRINSESRLAVDIEKSLNTKAAGQLPTGFDPGSSYPSKNHPRGLEMAIFAASDALNSLGIDWSELSRKVPPEAISVYAGSAMSQLDSKGYGGMIQARMAGRPNSARQCPFGFAEMSADFINAYVIGGMGNSGTVVGACASFLYNLRLAQYDIRSGNARIAIVGCSEAPVVPEVIEGYAAMGALATDEELRSLDGISSAREPDYSRSCRPFAKNCGFVIAESAQFLVLFDDRLAFETGANIHGGVADVFVNADGYKKSISSPGAGNYLTMARAAACAETLLGKESLQNRSFVMAHGTGTPQNRVTESQVLDRVANWFDIRDWPTSAIKCYLGHSIGTAAGDQIIAALGVWQEGWIPGISTMDEPAADVSCERLRLSSRHIETGVEGTDAALINSKGFGGNNSTALVLAPHTTKAMLAKRHGKSQLQAWQKANERVDKKMREMEALSLSGSPRVYYRCDESLVCNEQNIVKIEKQLCVDDLPAIRLKPDSCFADMTMNEDSDGIK